MNHHESYINNIMYISSNIYQHILTIIVYLVGGFNPSEKYESQYRDDEIANISGKIKNVPVTTNQCYIYIYIYIHINHRLTID